MLTREAVERLAEMRSEDYPIISLYLNLPRDPSVGTALIVLKNLLSQADEERARRKGGARDSLDRDIQRIRGFVDEERVAGARAVALFACSGLGLWEAHRSYLPLVNRMHVGPEVYLKPLLRLLDRAGRFGVALVDQARSRLFRVTTDGAEELLDLVEATPGKHDQGGWSQARYQRHHDDHVLRHLRRTGEELLRLHQAQLFHTLFVGGPEPVIDHFQAGLHPYLKEVLAKEALHLPLVAPPHEIYEQVRDRILARERAEEGELLEVLKGQSAQGNLGVAGLEPTLRALEQGQVRVLLVADAFRCPGRVCADCGHADARTDGGPCPYCGGGMQPVGDVVADAVEKAFAQEADVHFVESSDQVGHDPMEEVGQIGAILRFPVAGG